MKKILSLVLVLAMAFSAMLGITSFAEDAGVLVVSQASLEFADNVYLLIAVDYSAVGSADGITLKIKNNKTGEESNIDAPASDITAPTGCVAFKYDDIGAKMSNGADSLLPSDRCDNTQTKGLGHGNHDAGKTACAGSD